MAIKIDDQYSDHPREPFKLEITEKRTVCRFCLEENWIRYEEPRKNAEKKSLITDQYCLSFVFQTGPVGLGYICQKHAIELQNNLNQQLKLLKKQNRAK